jgi:hypothetical protein
MGKDVLHSSAVGFGGEWIEMGAIAAKWRYGSATLRGPYALHEAILHDTVAILTIAKATGRTLIRFGAVYVESCGRPGEPVIVGAPVVAGRAVEVLDALAELG